MLWHILDIFFVLFHTTLIIFNLFGWIWRKTRPLNLVTLLLTGASWSLLGLVVGTPGYCPFTDWHFSVLEKLGRTDIPDSYIKYLSDRLTGLSFSSSLVDSLTLILFLTALLISLFLNIKDYHKSHPKLRT
jgi:hypothetical protein